MSHRPALPPAPSPSSHLSEVQRAALALADAEAWTVAVEASGAVVTIRQGRPGRTLVLRLSSAPERSLEP